MQTPGISCPSPQVSRPLVTAREGRAQRNGGDNLFRIFMIFAFPVDPVFCQFVSNVFAAKETAWSPRFSATLRICRFYLGMGAFYYFDPR